MDLADAQRAVALYGVARSIQTDIDKLKAIDSVADGGQMCINNVTVHGLTAKTCEAIRQLILADLDTDLAAVSEDLKRLGFAEVAAKGS